MFFLCLLPKNFILRLEVYADDITLYLLNFVRQILFLLVVMRCRQKIRVVFLSPQNIQNTSGRWQASDENATLRAAAEL